MDRREVHYASSPPPPWKPKLEAVGVILIAALAVLVVTK